MARCLRDVGYLKRATRVLDAHHLATKYHSWIWEEIRRTWDTYRELTSPKVLKNRIKVSFPKRDDREPYTDLARKLYRMKKPGDSSSALDSLAEFVRMVQMHQGLEKAASALEKADIDASYEAMRDVMRHEVKTALYTHETWIENFEQRQADRKHRKENPELYPTIPTGFKTIDRIMAGGIQKGESGIIMATTGRGKSIMTNNLAYAAGRAGFKVAMIAFEMPARQVATRQDARWLGLPYSKFKSYDFSPSELRRIERRLKKIRARWEGRLHIFSAPIRAGDIGLVRTMLDDAWIESKFRPDLLILDSPDHLRPEGRSESYRLDQANVYWAVKGFAEEEGLAIWNTTQAGRDYADTLATAEATSESYDKARIADIILSLNEPKAKSRGTAPVSVEDEDDFDDEAAATSGASAEAMTGRRIELYLAKYRDGQSRISVPLDAQLERMYLAEIEEDHVAA